MTKNVIILNFFNIPDLKYFNIKFILEDAILFRKLEIEAMLNGRSSLPSFSKTPTTTSSTSISLAVDKAPCSRDSMSTSSDADKPRHSMSTFIFDSFIDLLGALKKRLDTDDPVQVTTNGLVAATLGTIGVSIVFSLGSSFFVYVSINKKVFKLNVQSESRIDKLADVVVGIHRAIVRPEQHFSIHDECV